MSRGGLVIGLGGSGVRVVLRVRQVLASSGPARSEPAGLTADKTYRKLEIRDSL